MKGFYINNILVNYMKNPHKVMLFLCTLRLQATIFSVEIGLRNIILEYDAKLFQALQRQSSLKIS